MKKFARNTQTVLNWTLHNYTSSAAMLLMMSHLKHFH